MRVTPPPFGTQYSWGGGLDGTQYAKGWYEVRRNSVISYADINFTLKGTISIKKHNTSDIQTQITLKMRGLFARAFGG